MSTEADTTQGSRRDALVQQLGAAVEALTTSDGWLAFLRAQRRFHSYSPNNRLLIHGQRPDAEYVAGYRTWQQMGRQVRRGEHALYVLAPKPYRAKLDDGTEEDRVGFSAAAVFDYAQTEAVADDAWEPLVLPTPAPTVAGLFDQLRAVAEGRGITVVQPCESDGPKTALGWYNRAASSINVRTWDDGEGACTLLHELAHALDPRIADAYTPAYPREEAELLAESVAWVVGREIGFDVTGQATMYLASWRATTETMAKAAVAVCEVADTLLADLGLAVVVDRQRATA